MGDEMKAATPHVASLGMEQEPWEPLTMSQDAMVSEQQQQRLFQIFSLPCTVSLLPFPSISRINELNKKWRALIAQTPEEIGYWPSMCTALAADRGLYTIYQCNPGHTLATSEFKSAAAKRVFFDELWSSRHKWAAGNDAAKSCSEAAFKIKIAARFRPEPRSDEALHLPLHQFLAIKRAKLAVGPSTDTSSAVLVGATDPPEMVDPIMAILMRDPVLLKSSGKICDRSVAVSSILRRGGDPFNGRKLSLDMLVPQPELAARIAEWRKEKAEKCSDFNVSVRDTKPLVDKNNALDPELLQMLQELEGMINLAEKAQMDASSATRRGRMKTGADGEEDADPAADNAAVIAGIDAVDALGALQALENNENHANLPSKVVGRPLEFIDRTSYKAEKPRVLDVNKNHGCVNMCEPGAGVQPYYFAQVYDGSTKQAEVYDCTARAAVHAALNGFNSTVMCYGQTGSGKTFTFFGPEGALDWAAGESMMPEDSGVLVRALADVLAASAAQKRMGITLALTAQYVEIFEEMCTDLISGAVVQIRRETGELVGCEEFALTDMNVCLDYLRLGQARKRFAATAMNDRSSRSHTVFLLHIAHTRQGTDALIKSHLSFVDLAGSERVKKSKVVGARLKEAIGINNSLLVLGKCIQALVSSAHHVPYYESRLTTLLKSSFGGSSRTHVLTCCRQSDAYGDETVWTLRFGERASMITNFAKVAAGSLASAVASLDCSLVTVKQQIQSLEKRGFAHLEGYGKLVASYKSLQLKRRDLDVVADVGKV